MSAGEEPKQTKLQKLGKAFRAGYAKLNPLKESHRKGVLRAVTQEWKQELHIETGPMQKEREAHSGEQKPTIKRRRRSH